MNFILSRRHDKLKLIGHQTDPTKNNPALTQLSKGKYSCSFSFAAVFDLPFTYGSETFATGNARSETTA